MAWGVVMLENRGREQRDQSGLVVWRKELRPVNAVWTNSRRHAVERICYRRVETGGGWGCSLDESRVIWLLLWRIQRVHNNDDDSCACQQSKEGAEHHLVGVYEAVEGVAIVQ